ncbi:hypothetical protein [Spirulina sp. 06S082]|uniref:hypothetical protein n=1 Tax=Spirulina sp. 06S082 TaxID=3110248 RepID=UPI002B1F9755|nr:hypothetical protein [Spirulina sp. 06S082]MEA5469962.1 hypothetical protein [Spirulina sp. 06S082]
MTESEIESGNVARYCKPSSLENGVPDKSAFEKRKGEQYLSVYRLEFFQKQTEKENIAEVRNYMEKKIRFNCKSNGSFAVLNIEQSKEYILEELSEIISYKEEGLPHCGLYHNTDDFLIAELLTECVQNNYFVKDIVDPNIPPSLPS